MIFHDPTWNLTGMNLGDLATLLGEWIMLDPSWSCMKTAIMEFARSLGRTWFVDHARSFVILHEDQP